MRPIYCRQLQKGIGSSGARDQRQKDNNAGELASKGEDMKMKNK